ncbi:hypothetical protein, partial [Gilliamella sp. wkB108]|uniref:hypothetical protein n=1 Tax=Gilliamella sp. wkB108 TaxID=3120256 RepID=UPI001147A024
MKTRCYLGLILLLSTPCYSQLFNIPEQYKGDCLVNKNNSIEENCPPNSIEIDFNDLYDIIHKNTVIYNDGDLKLVLNKKKYKYIDNQASYLQNIIVAEIELSLIYKQDIKDKIILASQFYSNEATWLGVQNYYISPNGNIYILLIK